MRTWRRLSQNFLYNRKLVAKLVRKSSIDSKNTVIEIGAGKGIITQELIKVAKQVIAFEVDPRLYSKLFQDFKNTKNIELFQKDFLAAQLPSYPYKVFANIPFAIEGQIIRKLLYAVKPPQDSYVVMRRELAYRIGGVYRESMFSLIHKPWFDFEIYHQFHRRDFRPRTRVNSAMLRFTQKTAPLLPRSQKSRWQWFMRQGFKDGKKLKHSLKNLISRDKLRLVDQKGRFSLEAWPSDLNLEQWLHIYTYII